MKWSVGDKVAMGGYKIGTITEIWERNEWHRGHYIACRVRTGPKNFYRLRADQLDYPRVYIISERNMKRILECD